MSHRSPEPAPTPGRTAGSSAGPESAPAPAGTTGARILDATLAVLARTGRQLSMSDVAQAAGISRMTLYRHHASKDELLRALARHEQQRFDEQLAASLLGVHEPSARIDAVLHAIVSFLDTSAAGVVVEAEPGFIIERMRQSLPVQRATIERLVGDALAELPAVRAGRTTTGELADLVLRVAMSEFLLPPPDAPTRRHDTGLRALAALVSALEGVA